MCPTCAACIVSESATPLGFLVCVRGGAECRAVLNGKKKVFRNQFSQKSPRALHVLNHGWWRLAVGGWQLVAVGCRWRLAAVGGGWRLAVDGTMTVD